MLASFSRLLTVGLVALILSACGSAEPVPSATAPPAKTTDAAETVESQPTSRTPAVTAGEVPNTPPDLPKPVSVIPETPLPKHAAPTPTATPLVLPTPEISATIAAAFDIADEWTIHPNPQGFSLEHPMEWKVRTDDSTGRIELKGLRGEQAFLWPVFLRTSLDPTGASLALREMATKGWPEVLWQAPTVVDGASVNMFGVSRQGVALAILTWTPSVQGSAGYIYMVSAPRERFREWEPVFRRVFRSFRAWGPPRDSEAAAALRYTQWQDPNERAFSVEVPSGWSIEGGTLRPNSRSVQNAVNAVSPDGRLDLLIGDTFPWFVEPNLFQPAGSTYTDPMDNSWPVQDYFPGEQFVTSYLLPLHDEQGRSLEIVREVSRPDLADQLAQVWPQQIDAGEVEYRFTRRGVQHWGKALVITDKFTLSDGISAWKVWRLYSWEAPESRSAEAEVALMRLAETFLIDPEWAQTRGGLIASQATVIQDMGDAVSNSITDAFKSTQQTVDEINRRGVNARLGVEEVVNPQTRESFLVENGFPYYWLDDQGVIIGTDTLALPEVDFLQLVFLP